jgi:hypothetical protein
LAIIRVRFEAVALFPGLGEQGVLVVWTPLRHSAIAAVVLVTLALLAGCQSSKSLAADSQTVYEKGNLSAAAVGNVDLVARAAEKALNQMGFVQVETQIEKAGGTVTARTNKDKKVSVAVAMHDKNASRVTIRVGVFGDEAVSRRILARIESNL